MTTDRTAQLLALPLPKNDSGATTVRGYLTKLLEQVWIEEEGFSGKRPFGNSSWQYDIYAAMTKAGMIEGAELDDDGYFQYDGPWSEWQAKRKEADALVVAAIAELGKS